MDNQTMQILAFLGATIVGFVMWGFKRAITQRDEEFKEIKRDIHFIKETLPKEYVSKDDYNSSIKEIKEKLDKLLDYIMENRK